MLTPFSYGSGTCRTRRPRKEVRLTTEIVKGRSSEAMLKQAMNRERIAHCKLDRLKSRFDRVQEEMLTSKNERDEFRDECERLREELAAMKEDKSRVEQEASMWRTQLFERMELLDQAKERLEQMKRQAEALRAKAVHAETTQSTSHQELKRRDRERKEFELKIEELESAQKHSRCETEEMLEALTDAKRAIDSLQRSNDYFQREIVGLKSIGASLTEKLTKVTQQRDRYKQRLNSRGDELRLEQGQSAHLLDEVERLKDELYETRGKLMTYQIEDDVREIRQAGTEKAQRAAEQKYADFPVTESVVGDTEEPKSLLSKATKKVSGWFRLSDKISPN
jgi:chromosome segregation ATPase